MSEIAATIFNFVALASGIIGCAIPYWEYNENNREKTYIGLWKYCHIYRSLVDGKKEHDCHSLDRYRQVTSSTNCVRALVILGFIMQALAFVFGFMKLCSKKEQQAAGRFTLFSGIVIIIAAVIFGFKTRQELSHGEYFDLHAGFWLCVTSGCLSIVAGILYYWTSEDNWYPHLRWTWLLNLKQSLRNLFTRSQAIPLEILKEDREPLLPTEDTELND